MLFQAGSTTWKSDRPPLPRGNHMVQISPGISVLAHPPNRLYLFEIAKKEMDWVTVENECDCSHLVVDMYQIKLCEHGFMRSIHDNPNYFNNGAVQKDNIPNIP
jgi:hypothetical protein